jgi:2-amino-4-hydroxy-6-hydroxymethyldihydropteridine diphosphokinase
MSFVYLSLGSNLSDKKDNLNKAIIELSSILTDLQLSPIYETEPWGYTEQPPFLNQCVGGKCNIDPFQLLVKIQEIEKKLGKNVEFKWGPRIIDIDILFYGNRIIQTDNLTIPHPYIQERAFVLIPLEDIARDFVHPILNVTIGELVGILRIK